MWFFTSAQTAVHNKWISQDQRTADTEVTKVKLVTSTSGNGSAGLMDTRKLPCQICLQALLPARRWCAGMHLRLWMPNSARLSKHKQLKSKVVVQLTVCMFNVYLRCVMLSISRFACLPQLWMSGRMEGSCCMRCFPKLLARLSMSCFSAVCNTFCLKSSLHYCCCLRQTQFLTMSFPRCVLRSSFVRQ